MGKYSYNQDHHRAAFDIWYDTRNWTATRKTVGAQFATLKSWASEEYVCKFNCPWHGWDKLIEERDRAMKQRVTLLNDGQYDITSHQQAMEDAIGDIRPAGKKDAITLIVHSDLQQISQWQYLYNKVYYNITGMALDYHQMKESQSLMHYRKGLMPTSLEGGIKMLETISKRIDVLKGSHMVSEEPEIKDAKGRPPKLSLEDLRKIRKLANENPSQAANFMSDDKNK